MAIIAALIAVAAAVAAGDLWLTVVCLRRRVVLGTVTALAGWALLGLAGAHGLGGAAAHAVLAAAGLSVLLGATLFGLGQGVEHLLAEPDDDAEELDDGWGR